MYDARISMTGVNGNIMIGNLGSGIYWATSNQSPTDYVRLSATSWNDRSQEIYGTDSSMGQTLELRQNIDHSRLALERVYAYLGIITKHDGIYINYFDRNGPYQRGMKLFTSADVGTTLGGAPVYGVAMHSSHATEKPVFSVRSVTDVTRLGVQLTTTNSSLAAIQASQVDVPATGNSFEFNYASQGTSEETAERAAGRWITTQSFSGLNPGLYQVTVYGSTSHYKSNGSNNDGGSRAGAKIDMNGGSLVTAKLIMPDYSGRNTTYSLTRLVRVNASGTVTITSQNHVQAPIDFYAANIQGVVGVRVAE
jgi:hypothetical protein